LEHSTSGRTKEDLLAENEYLRRQIQDLEGSISVLGKIEDALREKESRLLDFLENTHDLIQIVDIEGNFQYVNRQWLNTLGYTKRELSAINLWDIIHPDYKEHCIKIFAEVMKGGLVECSKAALLTKDKKTVFVEGSVSCRFEAGKAISHRAIFHDITRRKRDEDEREALINDLQTALKEIKTLGSMLPICCVCKKIRDDSGYWKQVEAYISEHTKTEFTHSICPECMEKALRELENDQD